MELASFVPSLEIAIWSDLTEEPQGCQLGVGTLQRLRLERVRAVTRCAAA